jgi:hypothetical protein
MIAQVSSRFAERNYLGVSGWVVIGKVAVPSPSNNLAFGDDHGSDRHLSGFKSALSATERFFHPALVHPPFWRSRQVDGFRSYRLTGGKPGRGSCIRTRFAWESHQCSIPAFCSQRGQEGCRLGLAPFYLTGIFL